MNVIRVKHDSDFNFNLIFNLYSIYTFFTVSYYILNAPNILINVLEQETYHAYYTRGFKVWVQTMDSAKSNQKKETPE